jgi:hypothetical protein
LLSVLVSTGIALQALGAVYWPDFLGYFSASPGIPLLLVASLLAPVCSPRNEMTGSADVARVAWAILVYGLLLSMGSLFVFGWSPLYAQKMAALALLTLAWLAPLLCLRQLYVAHLKVAVVVSLAIALVGYICSDLFPNLLPGMLRSALFSDEVFVYADARPRGFMAENSHFAALVGRLALILFLLWSARATFSAPRLVAFMSALALGMALLGSKGAAISAVLAIAALGLSRRLVPYLAIMLPVVWFVGELQTQSLVVDLENYSSTSTRLTLSVAASTAIALNPLGYGFYGFYGAMQGFGRWALDALSGLPLLFDEADEIINELINVSFKSTLLDFTVLFGAGFVFLIWRVVTRIDVADPRARVSLVYLLVSGLSTSGHESVSFFLGIAALVLCYPKPFYVVEAAERPLVRSQQFSQERTGS